MEITDLLLEVEYPQNAMIRWGNYHDASISQSSLQEIGSIKPGTPARRLSRWFTEQ
jgi:hypothetical protein